MAFDPYNINGVTAIVVRGGTARDIPDIVDKGDKRLGIFGRIGKDRERVANKAVPTLPIEGGIGNIGNINKDLKTGRSRGAHYLWW